MDALTNENFKKLEQRILDGISSVDLKQLRNIVKGFEGPFLTTGTGGSYAAAYFASRVLKTSAPATTLEPRDVLHEELSYYRTLIAVTYGNNNHGITSAINNAGAANLQTAVLTRSQEQGPARILIGYNHEVERSFISLAATLTPMAVMLLNKLGKSELRDYIKTLFTEVKNINIDPTIGVYEIMGGDNTKTAAHLLESNLVEAGLAIPITHDKYNYCHGRSTTSFGNRHGLIYLLNGPKTELDKLLLSELEPYYEQIILLQTDELDSLLGEYNLALQAMFLSKDIADAKHKGLSHVEYSPIVRKLYHFKGEM